MAFLVGEASEAILTLEDPAVTLVCCSGLIFVAIIEVTGICISSVSSTTIPISHLHEPNVQIRGHVMTLVLLNDSHQPTSPDWEWNGSFVENADINDIEGQFVEVINPATGLGVSSGVKDVETFVFRTSDLWSIGALLYSRVQTTLHQTPTISQTAQFLYRALDGE